MKEKILNPDHSEVKALTNERPYPAVLVLAGNDPSGGAGLSADLLTLASLGCHPLPVVTAITVQDSATLDDFLVMEPDWVVDQARMVLEDMPVEAFKVGMIGSVENVAAITELVSDYPDVPLVLDPVLASGSGSPMADDDLVAAMRDMLLPQVSVLTPNSLEARRLAVNDPDGDDDPDLDECARRLLALGPAYVLITGTHEGSADVVNVLYGPEGRIREDRWPRLPGSYHGSGCTLASALTAFLAQGVEIGEAVREAQAYTYQTLAHAFRPGMGQFIPDRLFWSRDEAEPENPEEDAGAEPE
ncbi:Hydroxymethylpyrimidine/phosphomethylpyrimidine kinase [Gulbenkiania indica]|uniref:hydroxymethylpyrimidine kinase n=1 Tax=Gulbenkiania indica TaxID=375574 RepID=A0A0K6GX26_9NEIS|nr:Hydroxymethylpyrimidine/phosphomethylpyrimidine kinase [Gulbenkiania indica]